MILKNIPQRRLMELWYFNCFLLTIFIVFPISYGIVRSAIVVLGSLMLLGIVLLLWRNKLMRLICITLLFLLGIFVNLPGKEINQNRLRYTYIEKLKNYEGTRYLWGGENRIGIDCSGLVRSALIKANWQRGLAVLNPTLIRNAFLLWWYDASAIALRDEYRGYTERLFTSTSINELDHSKLQPGDLAVTADGSHILAYLGDKTWIEADPLHRKVMVLTVPQPDNYWFSVPVQILRWRQFVAQ